MRLRSDISIWNRIRLRLTGPIHEKRIVKRIEEFSKGDSEYAGYVEAQIRRTRPKQFTNSRSRLDPYVDLVLTYCSELPNNPKILSLGTRNRFELDAMSDRGLNNVTGMDLWTTDSRIVKGDMHAMELESDQFDLVFASHVFEHSWDFTKVAAEVVRVLKPGGYLFCAFPINFKVNAHDRIDLESTDNLISNFPNSPETIHSEKAFHFTDELRVILKMP